MAEKTVTIEKTVEESETISICNECGREVDDEGKTYKQENTLDDSKKLDFCSECLEKLSNIDGSDDTDEYVERVEEWLDTEDYGNDTMRRNIRVMVGSAVLLSLSGWLVAAFPAAIAGALILALFSGVAFVLFTIPLLQPEHMPDRFK